MILLSVYDNFRIKGWCFLYVMYNRNKRPFLVPLVTDYWSFDYTLIIYHWQREAYSRTTSASLLFLMAFGMIVVSVSATQTERNGNGTVLNSRPLPLTRILRAAIKKHLGASSAMTPPTPPPAYTYPPYVCLRSEECEMSKFQLPSTYAYVMPQ